MNKREISEINSAAEFFRYTKKALIEMTVADFPLPTLEKILCRSAMQCERGTGVSLIQGFPIVNISEESARTIAWGVGLYIGVPLIQDANASLLVDVRDRGDDSTQTLRGNSSNAEIGFHVDNCDLVTLLCRRRSLTGGKSLLASSIAIHNALVLEYPELLEKLYDPFPFIDLSKLGKVENAFFMSPVFGFEKGYFTSRYYRERILAAARIPTAPALSDRHKQAVNVFLEIALRPTMHLEMDLEPGDLQMLNNHVVCHARTSFEDAGGFDRKRHLFRQWFATPLSRPLPASFKGPYGRTEPATVRGGYRHWIADTEILKFQKRMARQKGMAF